MLDLDSLTNNNNTDIDDDLSLESILAEYADFDEEKAASRETEARSRQIVYEALGETRVVLLDSHSCWGSGCYLPDGAHLTDIGIRRWYDFLAQNLLARGYLMDDLAAKSLPELRRAAPVRAPQERRTVP